MCTLSVITRDNGYFLAVNRDERIAREAAPPTQVDWGETKATYPHDSEGGTWVAANDHGTAFALLNWNDVVQSAANKTRSRGLVVPAAVRLSFQHDVQAAFDQADLNGLLPFRLIGVFPEEREIREWRWNREVVNSQRYPWQPRHWFSSSLSDGQADALRGAVCRNAWNEEYAGSLPWLRKLHASHANGPGPFSLCVHREDVRTLSYTEISCTPAKIRCDYFSGSPCTMPGTVCSLEMDRVPISASHGRRVTRHHSKILAGFEG